MGELLKGSALLLVVVTLLYVAINGIAMNERKRIMLIYIFAYVLSLAGTFRLLHIAIGTFAVLVLTLEFFSDDTRRLQLLNRLRYRVTDLFYRLFLEYAFGWFVLSLWAIFAAHLWQSHTTTVMAMHAIGLFCILSAIVVIADQKYSTKSITAIMDQIEGDMLTYQLTVTPHMRTLFNILISIEDREYFERKENQHTIPIKRFITKGFDYVRAHFGFGLIRIFRNVFKRGYGTIEMQLLRSVGIEFGYVYEYRRKVFEILYANMLFNSYLAYLKREHGEYKHFREYIVRKYIDNVDVKINGHVFRASAKKSSLLAMFNKNDISKISKEEFLVWCLGLPQKNSVTTADLNYKHSVVMHFDINFKKAADILARFD